MSDVMVDRIEPGWAGAEPLVFELSNDYTGGPRVTAAGVPEVDIAAGYLVIDPPEGLLNMENLP